MGLSGDVSLTELLLRVSTGDVAARNTLIDRVLGRLKQLATRMLDGNPRLRRWEQSDNLVQNACIRLLRALRDCPLSTPSDFFAIAATQMRRELIDLHRHHFGPLGAGRRHATPPPGSLSRVNYEARFGTTQRSDDPAVYAAWGEFHEQVEHLPQELKQVFDLLWYADLPQADAARILEVSVPTIKRRWRDARLRLEERLGESGPV